MTPARSIETDGTLTFDDKGPRYQGNLALTRVAGLALSSGKTIASDPWRIESKVKIDSLLAFPLFAGMAEPTLAQLQRCVKSVEYPAAATIIAAGQEHDDRDS